MSNYSVIFFEFRPAVQGEMTFKDISYLKVLFDPLE